MTDIKAKMDSMLFDHITTNRTDYKGGELRATAPTMFHAKPKSQRRRGQPVKDVHTLSEWKQPVPFNLLHKLRPIINTSPYTVQQKYETTVDEAKLEAQKTRPRLIMTPAVGMDDIVDPRAREILVTDMYTSETSRGLREAVSGYSRVQAPFPGLPAPANPIVAPRFRPPVVPLEWRMETIAWDNKQLRSYCDPTKEFWLAQDLPECRACREFDVIAEHRKMKRKLNDGRH